MTIKEIRKINVQDGDLIMFPLPVSIRGMSRIHKALRKLFPEKRFLMIWLDEETIKGIKVLHLKKGDRKE